MPLPRLTAGQYEGVSTFLNATADEIDRLGVGCVVRRTAYGTIANNVDTAISWQALDLDTSQVGMWSPDVPYLVTCRVPGIYTIIVQARFASYETAWWIDPVTGPPYNVGRRAARILINAPGQTPTIIAASNLPATDDFEGTTITMRVMAALDYGHQVRVGLWQNSGSTIRCSHPDFGGTFAALAYSGPI